MKTMRVMSASLLLVLMAHSATSRAEDIDIYSGMASNGTPNLMFVVDNPSSQNNEVGPCTYWDGTLPSQGSKALGNDQCALANIVHGMATKSDGSAIIYLGITTMSGVVLKLTPIDDHPYTGTYTVPGGTTNRQAFILAVKALNTNSGKSGQGAELQETWAYYTGGNGGTTGTGILSGTSYTGTNATIGCQKNYIIYLSNVKAAASHAQDNGEGPVLTAAINYAVTNNTLTSAQGTTLATIITPALENGEGREWARFMKTVDINSTGTGSQTVITYSVGTGDTAVPPAAITNTMEQYISAVALYGGGKYFPAGNDSSVLTSSILKILNEVQAVNSVFSSSSLPVSVNAQGTYLNQIYMGMFRPDPGANPRWVGNLKQYQFVYDAVTDTLSMGDSFNQPAISSAGTGFISPNAISFWTCGNLSYDTKYQRPCPTGMAEPTSGFWVNNQQGVGLAYDLPDGELVEKGGAAQIMRQANLTDNYAATAGTSTNPRNLYTYCPSGTACTAALSDTSNAFATTNAGITAAMFGGSSSLRISSIVRTGTSAVVTTSVAHGYGNGASVTISGATQPEYWVTQNITVNSPTTFTITGLPDTPTTPSAGAYTAGVHNAAAQNILTITRSLSGTTAGTWSSGCVPNLNCETATVTTSGAHGYSAGDSVQITGASPADYMGIKTIASSGLTSTQFTYSVPIYPPAPAVNTYTAVVHPYSRTLTGITKISGNWTASTGTVAHGFHAGQVVNITGANTSFIGNMTIATVPSITTFTLNSLTNPAVAATGGSVSPSTTPVVLGGLSRSGTGTAAAGANPATNAATATATGLSAGVFANGNTVDIVLNTGTAPNESGYLASGVVISCTTSPANTVGGPCTGSTFTYPITATPALSASGTMQVALATTTASIPAGGITRSGTTATAVTTAANGFNNGDSVDISASGTAYTNESAYTGTWPISCSTSPANTVGSPCTTTTFTFGPVTLSPATPATGANMTVYQGSTPPAKDPLINWVRGQDNFGDELSLCPPGTAAGAANCPTPAVTVRPSFHGDVLHSRPVVLNYGGNIGVVVFYGANDGVYRAINGNQTHPATSTLPAPAGGELWGFIPTDFFAKLERQRTNSPQLKFSTTPAGILPAPLVKDYFADGSTGIYQLLDANKNTTTAHLYLAMRRGGQFMYALDVSTPTSPQFLWKIEPAGLTIPSTSTNPSGFTASTDFTELGQTWSAPKVAMVDGYPTPVLIFGGGYDPVEDHEPPEADTMGRGIFIVDALTGALIWSATQQPTGVSACSGNASKATCLVAGMDYSIPADITLVDRDGDGKIDRLYAVDVGGNVWRVDLEPTLAHNTPQYWQVNKLAALGCDGGVCASGVTPRKFFYPADIVPSGLFDAVLVGQGDREHPMLTDAAYSVSNRFYMLKDYPGSDGTRSSPIILANLFDATSGTYAISLPSTVTSPTTPTTPNLGYYVSLGTGEKVVNAPLTVAGFTYFGTNQPQASTSCSPNLGKARSYQVEALAGTSASSVFAGGGLPPSPVAGVVSVSVTSATGVVTEKLVPFIIGAGNPANGAGGTPPTGCTDSALQGCRPDIQVSTRRNRTYWYRKMD